VVHLLGLNVSLWVCSCLAVLGGFKNEKFPTNIAKLDKTHINGSINWFKKIVKGFGFFLFFYGSQNMFCRMSSLLYAIQ